MIKSLNLNFLFYYFPFNFFNSKKYSNILFLTVFNALLIILIITSSVFDRTLILDGQNIGLLEHPAIWMFFVLQLAIPFIFRTCQLKINIYLNENCLIHNKEYLENFNSDLASFIKREKTLSKFWYNIFILIGLFCFIWNSYQNQLPYKFLNKDFWDSINHSFGYWLTRGYKFYLWVLYLPIFAHIQFGILISFKAYLKLINKKNIINLNPYHNDGNGGCSEIIKTAIFPSISILILISLTLISVIIIHKKLDFTVMIGSFILTIIFIIIYLIPAFVLQKIIKVNKEKQLKLVTNELNTLYIQVNTENDKEKVIKILSTIEGLAKVSSQISSISTWPYWKPILKVLTLSNIPILINLIGIIYKMLKNQF